LNRIAYPDLAPQLSEVDVDDYFEVGYMAAKSALSRGERFTAIVAASDLVAQGVYWALADCHLKVPKDVSVTGFDDIDAAFLHPPLTTVSAFPEQIGKRLGEMLLNRVAHSDLPPQRRMIPTRVVMRGSHNSPPVELKERIEGRDQVAYRVKTGDGGMDSDLGLPVRNSQAAEGAEFDQPEVLQHRK
jgi:ABC-type sugar transport system substrate-binding protein